MPRPLLPPGSPAETLWHICIAVLVSIAALTGAIGLLDRVLTDRPEWAPIGNDCYVLTDDDAVVQCPTGNDPPVGWNPR